jgi:hypothetical protein
VLDIESDQPSRREHSEERSTLRKLEVLEGI